MQGLADGYFVAPYTVGDYLAGLLGQTPVSHRRPGLHSEAEDGINDEIKRWLSVGGTKSPDHYHRELGKIVWDYCGMARDKNGLEKAISRDPGPARGVLRRTSGCSATTRASTSPWRRSPAWPTSSSSAS